MKPKTLLVTVGILLCLAPALAAQTDTSQMTPLQKFQHGAGWIGWIIEAQSVVALTLIVKYSMEMRKSKLAPPEVVDEIEALLEAEEYQEAMEVCESEPCFFTNVVAAGLAKINTSFDTMEKSIGEMLDEENSKISGKLSWLTLHAAIAPMLGLLGTVQGMIGAFDQIAASKGQATPDQLADNIAMALITTLLGLMVAIPVTSCFVIIRNRFITASIDISAAIEDMFERFRPKSQA
jgi:biopolymer transport protein ExbB